MASFRLNVATIRGLPSTQKLLSAMKAFGMPPDEEFGVLSHAADRLSLTATIVHRSSQAIHQLDRARRNVISAPVERIVAYPLRVAPAKGRLEIYHGSPNGIERIHAFLSKHLSVPATIERIQLDVARAAEKLSGRVDHFQLRSVRLHAYSHNPYMIGRYSPRFLDTEHGLEFLAEHDEGVLAATVRFASKNGRVGATLTRNACFAYSCNEDDREGVQALLRRLV